MTEASLLIPMGSVNISAQYMDIVEVEKLTKPATTVVAVERQVIRIRGIRDDSKHKVVLLL